MVERLLRDGWQVRGLDLFPCPVKEVEFVQGDLGNLSTLEQAVRGVDTIFHVAAAPYKGSRELFWSVNVEGTQKLLDVAASCGVQRFVFTSSCSVVFRGEPIVDGDESMPYTEASFWFKDPYALTKAEAERRVLQTNGTRTPNGTMLTVALRPHQIYGPGDRLYMPQVASRAKKLKIAMGNGRNKFVTTYVDNCVEGHILAAEALRKPNSPAAGQAYNINDGTTGNFWDYTFRIAAEVGGGDRASMGRYWIPKPVALGMSWIAEIIGNVTGQEVPLNWLATMLVTTDRTYTIAKAKRDLGYKPIVSMEEGFKTTIADAKVTFAEQQRQEALNKKANALPLLSYWLLIVSLVSLFGTIQAFYTTDLLKQYQFNLAPQQVTPLTGRLFGCWTLLATLLRLTCALSPRNTAIYRLTIITFIIAITFFCHNFYVAQTMDLRNVAMPFAFALPSFIWMVFFPPKLSTQK